ncbi:MAG: hypothetical protein ACRDT4_25630, partial [Micromonosporaceae bacterium]
MRPAIVERGPDPSLVPLAAGLAGGYRLTAAPGGVVLHRDGVTPAPATVTEAIAHAVSGGLTVVVDPSVTDLRVVNRYLQGLPAEPDRAVTVLLPVPERAYPPARAIRLADWLGRAPGGPVRVLYSRGALNEQPAPGGRLAGVDTRGAATFPELAQYFTVLPEDVTPPAPHGLPPATRPGTYDLAGSPGWVVEQSATGLWVRPAGVDQTMPAATQPTGGGHVVVGAAGVVLTQAELTQLVRAVAPVLPPGVQPRWHLDVADRPLPESVLPSGVQIRQTPTGVVLYEGEAPSQDSLDELPARPGSGGLVVVLDASVTEPASLRPVLDALLDGERRTPVVRLTGPLLGQDLAALAGALLGGRGIVEVADATPGTVPVDARGRVTFPELARRYRVDPAATPYGLAPAAAPDTYQLPAGWVIGPVGPGLWARPADAADAPPAPADSTGRPRIVIGVPGVAPPPDVLGAIADIAAVSDPPELLAPTGTPIGPQAIHRPLPSGVSAIPAIHGLFVLPSASDTQARTAAVLRGYAASAGLPEQIVDPATMLVVDGPVDPATRTVKTTAGTLSPTQLVQLLRNMPYGMPDTVVLTDPGALVAGAGGLSLAKLLAGTVPASVIGPAGEVDITANWRLGATGTGWHEHRASGVRPLGLTLAYPSPWDGAAEPSTGQPDTVQPDTVQPDTGQPDTVQPGTGQPETGQPETAEPVPRTAPESESTGPASEGTGSESGSTAWDASDTELSVDERAESDVSGTEPTSLGDDDAKPPPEISDWIGWKALPAAAGLTVPAQEVLASLGLHGLADEPGTSLFAKVAVSAGYLGDAQVAGLTAASVQAWRMELAAFAWGDKLRAGTDWPLFGLTAPDDATVTKIKEWLDGGLDPNRAPRPLVKDLPPASGGVEAVLRLLAPLLGRQIRLVRADGAIVAYGPGADVMAPTVTLVQDESGVLGTVPYQQVPALLAPGGGSRLVRPVVSAAPTALPDERITLRDLPGFLATISGVPGVTLPGQAELSERLRDAVRTGTGQLTPGPGLAGALAQIRAAIAAQARPEPATEPVQWTPAGGPDVLTEFQAQYLAGAGRSAVWNPAGPNAFFEALVRAGQYDEHRLLGLAGWNPAELRAMFGALLQADLAAAGNAWPLLNAGPEQLPDRGPLLLDWVAQVADPGVTAPQELPEGLARTIAELFGVRVVLVEPYAALPEVAPSDGDPDTLPVLHLVVDAAGHTMATVTAAGSPGTVVRPVAAGASIPAVPGISVASGAAIPGIPGIPGGASSVSSSGGAAARRRRGEPPGGPSSVPPGSGRQPA